MIGLQNLPLMSSSDNDEAAQGSWLPLLFVIGLVLAFKWVYADQGNTPRLRRWYNMQVRTLMSILSMLWSSHNCLIRVGVLFVPSVQLSAYSLATAVWLSR
jgi:hypothetical protein